MSVTQQRYCTFVLEGKPFGVAVDRVQEVNCAQEMTPVPLGASAVSGLINLRGQIVAALDLRRCLGMPERKADEKPMNVVVRAADRVVSLLVDEIGEVLDLGSDTFEKVPNTVGSAGQALFAGVHKLSETLLVVLDVDRAVSAAMGNGEAEGAK
ncbi:MAG TPA: chemotaxis protein CheW [Myxococcales bacterium]|nr:chemotaxis protein CheW [Myxococcales bacterium]